VRNKRISRKEDRKHQKHLEFELAGKGEKIFVTDFFKILFE
jgi:hypothetical protein